LQSTSGMSACASRMGIAVLPRKGDALLFWDAQPDGQTVDRHSLHASCPTSRGEKWTG
ncbi:Fe2OG dioxygenase domain-containing protein, partial [Haematococcus lacustris]